ncbi:MAG TPA: aminotransferase class V-fold PLP-dependent enzyme [Candidatus Cryosericum sp.]|nr:aminotransferase class V-fold PLP-dependent enzyme [Candidatus Cryosericum sp.]
MAEPRETIAPRVRDELDSLWQAVFDNMETTRRVASDRFAFLLPDETISHMEEEEAWSAYVRKRLFLTYGIAAGQRSGRPLEPFVRELDHMVRALMPFTQRWQAEADAGREPALPVLDASMSEEEQLALVRLQGAVLFPGEDQPLPGRRLLLAPSHGRLAPEVLRAAGTSFESWSEVERADAECRDGLLPLLGSERAQIAVIPGAASLGLEVVLVAASSPGGIVQVLGQGPQGRHIARVATGRGRVVDLLEAPDGGTIDVDRLKRHLLEARPSAVVLAAVDAVSGSTAPVDAYAEVVHDAAPQAMFIIDATWSAGCMVQRMDAWHADVLFTDSFSCLGGCPGLVLVAVGERVQEQKVHHEAAAPLYIELRGWLSPQGADVPPSQVFALRSALRLISSEGLAARADRFSAAEEALRNHAVSAGWTAAAPADRASSTLTVLQPPSGVDPASMQRVLARKGIDVGLGSAGLIIARAGDLSRDEQERLWRVLASAPRDTGQQD